MISSRVEVGGAAAVLDPCPVGLYTGKPWARVAMVPFPFSREEDLDE
jgi:hypothetical protein